MSRSSLGSNEGGRWMLLAEGVACTGSGSVEGILGGWAPLG